MHCVSETSMTLPELHRICRRRIHLRICRRPGKNVLIYGGDALGLACSCSHRSSCDHGGTGNDGTGTGPTGTTTALLWAGLVLARARTLLMAMSAPTAAARPTGTTTALLWAGLALARPRPFLVAVSTMSAPANST